jgi:hypothetical protein
MRESRASCQKAGHKRAKERICYSVWVSCWLFQYIRCACGYRKQPKNLICRIASLLYVNGCADASSMHPQKKTFTLPICLLKTYLVNSSSAIDSLASYRVAYVCLYITSWRASSHLIHQVPPSWLTSIYFIIFFLFVL